MQSPGAVLNGRFLTHDVTGVERYATEIGRRLLQHGDMRVVAPRGTSRPDWVPENAWTVTGRLTGHAWEQIDLPRYLRRTGSPVLVNLCNTGPIGYRRQVIAHHDVAYLRHPRSYNWRFRAWYRVLAWLLLRRAHVVVTVSAFSRGEIADTLGIDPHRIRIVPNAVGPAFRSPQEGPREAYAVAVGSPSLHKNTATLVDAWGRVFAATGVELRLVGSALIVGSTATVSHAPGVAHLGRVSDDVLIDLYSRARLSIVPSTYEGFGLPVLESQSCGCPVAVADAGALPEVAAGSAVLIDPADPEAMAATLIDLLDDDVRLQELAARGRTNVERFSWDTSAELVRDAIRDAARPR